METECKNTLIPYQLKYKKLGNAKVMFTLHHKEFLNL